MHTLKKVLESVSERMKTHRSIDIAKVSGIHVNTVRAIRNGVNTNPTIDTLHAIIDSLDSMEGVEND